MCQVLPGLHIFHNGVVLLVSSWNHWKDYSWLRLSSWSRFGRQHLQQFEALLSMVGWRLSIGRQKNSGTRKKMWENQSDQNQNSIRSSWVKIVRTLWHCKLYVQFINKCWKMVPVFFQNLAWVPLLLCFCIRKVHYHFSVLKLSVVLNSETWWLIWMALFTCIWLFGKQFPVYSNVLLSLSRQTHPFRDLLGLDRSLRQAWAKVIFDSGK